MANVLQIEWVFILNLLLVLLHFDVWVGNGICCRFTLLILCFGHLTPSCSYSARRWTGAAIARSLASPPFFPQFARSGSRHLDLFGGSALGFLQDDG
jgi:hypothetical protein